jgi:cation diffusion facilitator CzcD-associated flavoprotein CzcO
MSARNGSPETTAPAAIDRAALRAKYREEREKRLRPDGNDQYVEPSGAFAHFLDDCYTEPSDREPLFDDVTVAIIGGGFSGLVTGARLVQAGITGIRIIEGGGDVGGAWYWNRYPGAMCDTAAMIYLPLLEETGHMPSRKYTFAPEIFGHAQRIARHFGLYENALFSTEVTGLAWDDPSARWIISTNRGDRVRAKFVTMGTGPLHRPKLPGIPGIERFSRHCFHTSRWDYDYTGGDATGAPMDNLNDKRVGIIGTGATAVQCIPPLARATKDLFVFQRTPSSVDVRNNHPIDPGFFSSLEAGWQEKWLMNFAILQTGGFADEDLVQDGWTDISQRIRDRVVANLGQSGTPFGPEAFRQAYEESDDEKMTEIRARIDSIVEDRPTGENLKAWYRQLCKRPCFHDEYLQAFNLPNVHLVDTDGRGVEAIDETGVVASGKHFELDCLIFASGFEVGTDYTRRSGFDVVGREGRRLSEHWAEGMRTMHGIHVHGFPNMFIVGPSQAANLISNITHNLTEAATTIALVVARAAEVGADHVEVSGAAESAWVSKLAESGQIPLSDPDCTPGYYNNEGRPVGRRELLNAGRYPEGPVAYFEYISAWRNSGSFEGLEYRTAVSA